jgi:hypothetical protein
MSMIAILVAALLFGTQLPLADAWEQANRDTKRIEPAALAGIPDAIRAALIRRRCAIPQPWGTTGQRNVVRGRFNDGPVVDWAVLCSRDLSSTILVFWDNSASSIAELATTLDAAYLQVVIGRQIGFSRAIDVASPVVIREYAGDVGRSKLPSLDHDGINDAFVGKASVIWYWHQGQWLQLEGAD